MPLWSEILRELAGNLRDDGSPDFDVVRRKYLGLLNWYVTKTRIATEIRSCTHLLGYRSRMQTVN